MKEQAPELNPIILSTPEGLEVEVLAFGATVKSIKVFKQTVTLEYPNAADYQENPYYFGSTIGRYANRIANGCFSLNAQTYQLAKGTLPHALHGGEHGFSHKNWVCTELSPSHCVLTLVSPHGDNGFPGELQVTLCIRLEQLALQFDYSAICTADTVISLTNHTYFNLNQDKSSLAEHSLQLNAAAYLAVTDSGIPTGEVMPVAGSCFDFSNQKPVLPALQQTDAQLAVVNGFDHFFILRPARDITEPAAVLVSEQSGIGLQVFTDQPGVQFYSGNFLSAPFNARSALCLEAQHWPDAPNQPQFPSAVLLAGECYQKHIRFQFFNSKANQ
jgi:aldose 1-epimerase